MSDKPWSFPLECWSFPLIPDGDHRGAFGKVRKHDIHTGVDLYCPINTKIFAVEGGRVIAIENFTGPDADDPSPWWHDTQALLVEGESGVVLYGEVMIPDIINVGHPVKKGELIAFSRQVLKKDKGLPMCMLHFELYKPGTVESVWWLPKDKQPENLLNPTDKLREAFYNLDNETRDHEVFIGRMRI